MSTNLPRQAEVVDRTEESPSTFTLHLRLTDGEPYRFEPGQFNMLYLHGAGEVAISIVAEDAQTGVLTHTMRALGRVTKGLQRLRIGEHIGLRGPFGQGWPMQQAQGRDLVIVTGGLGCAPSVSIIHHVLAQRARYGRLSILQGVKHADDLIWREQYAGWAQLPNTQVLLAADVAAPGWRGHVGLVTALFDQLELDAPRSSAMLCGPEPMMQAAAEQLYARGLAADAIFLSMERNMQCAIGHCGHCQIGPDFVCRDGPVFPWPRLQPLLGVRGF